MKRITLATTEDEFRDVRRFWYRIYCVVRGVLRDKADHERGELDDPLLGVGRLFVARDANGEVQGTLMATYNTDGPLGDYADFYELDRLVGEKVAIVTKLMVTPDRKGTGLSLELLRAATAAGVHDGVAYAVYDANPPTDSLFHRLGGVDWLGFKHHPSFGHVRVMYTRLRDDAPILSSPGHPLAMCYERNCSIGI